MNLATLSVAVDLDATKFNTGVKNTLSESKSFAQKIGADADSIKNAFTNAFSFSVGQLMADGFKQALGFVEDFTRESVEVAADLTEIRNVIDTMFAGEADEIYKWARGAKDAYGMSEKAALNYFSELATLLKTIGVEEDQLLSTSLNTIGRIADIASFKNLGFDETFNMVRSGLRGETESVERLGLSVHVATMVEWLGLEKETDFTKEKTQAEQYMDRYKYIMEQTSFMEGDFQRTSGSFSNQMKILNTNVEELQKTIGEELLPAATSLVTWLNSLFGGAENAEEAVGNMSSAFATAYADIDNTAENALKLVNVLERMEKDGVTTDDEFAAWAKTLTELQTLIPSISTLVDEQTMSITGGTSALRAHTEAWKTDGVAMARAQIMQDYYEKVAAQEIKVAQAELAYRAKEAQYQDYIGLESSLEKQAQEHLMKTNPTAYKSWADTYKGFWGVESVDNLLINLDRAGDPTSRALAESLRETRKLRDESFSAEEKEVFEAEKVQLEALRNELKNLEAVMEALTAEDEKNKTPQPKTASEALTELRTYSQQYADQALAGNYEAAQETWSALAALATDEQEAMLREAVTYWQKNGSGQPILPEDFYQYDESGRAVYTDWVTAWEEQIRAEEKRKADEAAVAALMASAGDDEYPDDYVYTGEGEDDTGDSGSTGEFSGTIIVNVYLDGQEIGDIITERVEANIAREAATGSKTN